MDKKKKVKEDRARRMAKRRGFTFVKNRRRDPLALGYGTCWLEENGIRVTKPSNLDGVLRFLGEADALISGFDEASTLIMNVLIQASATGWLAVPPAGGPSLSLVAAFPRLIREYSTAKQTATQGQATQ